MIELIVGQNTKVGKIEFTYACGQDSDENDIDFWYVGGDGTCLEVARDPVIIHRQESGLYYLGELYHGWLEPRNGLCATSVEGCLTINNQVTCL
jgi:hypothetical protein